MKRTISGIRGVFGKDLGLKDILHYCDNFATLIDAKKCLVSRDTRESGHMIAETAKAALMKNGINVYDLGVAPTPVIFREARRYGAGIMITASHNPTDWNGLKFTVGGRGINQSQLDIILDADKYAVSEIGAEESIDTTYIADVADTIGKIDNSPTVVVDLGGGAARGFAPCLLEQLGCKVNTINSSIQKCHRGPDPTTDELVELLDASTRADIGFAFDLDGDRLVVVKDGKKQAPDVTLGLGIAWAIESGCRKFVLSTDTSVAIEKFITEKGGTVQRSKVGEANVVDMMVKMEAEAGGEGSSAGFILPQFNYCRDGILSSGIISAMLDGSKFDEILTHMERYHQIRRKIPTSKHHNSIIEKIAERLSKEFSDTDMLDGLKCIIDENSWVLVRKSNTEDVIRISGEADSQDKCERNVQMMLGVVNQIHEHTK